MNNQKNMLEMVKSLQEYWGSLPEEPQVNLSELICTYSQIAEELEEWDEVICDIIENDKVVTEDHIKDFRDVSIDLIFFILQAVVRTGQSEVFMEDFKKIYKNNMTKVVHDPKVLEETLQMYSDKGIEVYAQKVMPYGHWVVKRKEDDKVMKSVKYKEVVL